MKYMSQSENGIELVLSLNELYLLNNCINEALELGNEFSIRVGQENEFARKLMKEIQEVILKARFSNA